MLVLRSSAHVLLWIFGCWHKDASQFLPIPGTRCKLLQRGPSALVLSENVWHPPSFLSLLPYFFVAGAPAASLDCYRRFHPFMGYYKATLACLTCGD